MPTSSTPPKVDLPVLPSWLRCDVQTEAILNKLLEDAYWQGFTDGERQGWEQGTMEATWPDRNG